MDTSSPAYNKMFEDGRAFNPIHISQPTPDTADTADMGGSGGSPEEFIGEKIERDTTVLTETPETDYSLLDTAMEERRNAFMNRATSGDAPNAPVNAVNNSGGTITKKELSEIKNRLGLIEQALSLVMEQQKILIQENKT
jgi:hypothetical protein